MDRRPRPFPRRGVFREVFVRAQSHLAGAAGCHRVCRWRQPCYRRFAFKTEGKRRHRTNTLRDRNPGALCRDVCRSSLLSLRFLRSHPNVFIDDVDHGDRVSTRRPVEWNGRRCAWDRRRFSHAGIAFDRRRLPSRPLRLYRVARCRSSRRCATATMEYARDSRRTRNSVNAVRLDHHVLCSGKIFRRQQSPCCHGGVCGISRAVSCSGSVGKANRENEPRASRLRARPR